MISSLSIVTKIICVFISLHWMCHHGPPRVRHIARVTSHGSKTCTSSRIVTSKIPSGFSTKTNQRYYYPWATLTECQFFPALCPMRSAIAYLRATLLRASSSHFLAIRAHLALQHPPYLSASMAHLGNPSNQLSLWVSSGALWISKIPLTRLTVYETAQSLTKIAYTGSLN